MGGRASDWWMLHIYTWMVWGYGCMRIVACIRIRGYGSQLDKWAYAYGRPYIYGSYGLDRWMRADLEGRTERMPLISLGLHHSPNRRVSGLSSPLSPPRIPWSNTTIKVLFIMSSFWIIAYGIVCTSIPFVCDYGVGCTRKPIVCWLHFHFEVSLWVTKYPRNKSRCRYAADWAESSVSRHTCIFLGVICSAVNLVGRPLSRSVSFPIDLQIYNSLTIKTN